MGLFLPLISLENQIATGMRGVREVRARPIETLVLTFNMNPDALVMVSAAVLMALISTSSFLGVAPTHRVIEISASGSGFHGGRVGFNLLMALTANDRSLALDLDVSITRSHASRAR